MMMLTDARMVDRPISIIFFIPILSASTPIGMVRMAALRAFIMKMDPRDAPPNPIEER